MRKDITIAAEPRSERGKNEARRLRAAGRVPGVLYGAGKGSRAVSLEPRQVNRILFSDTGHNTIFNVEVNGEETCPAMIVDWQHDPVKDTLLHVDLKRIDMTQPVSVSVPVHTEGDPVGVKQQGGLMEVVTREIEIECLPDDIPEHFVVDVQPLRIGQNLRAGDIPLGDKIRLKTPADTVICHVIALRTSETPAAEEAAAEGEAETGAPKAEDEKKG